MINGNDKEADRQTLKRKYLECFNVRTTKAATSQEVVTSLIDSGVSRETLINWGEYAGYSRITVSSTVSRNLCSTGLRERREGAGRKPSHDALVLLDHAREQYGERALKVLRSAFRAGRAAAMAAKNLRGTVEIGGNKNNIGTTIRCSRRPAKRVIADGPHFPDRLQPNNHIESQNSRENMNIHPHSNSQGTNVEKSCSFRPPISRQFVGLWIVFLLTLFCAAQLFADVPQLPSGDGDTNEVVLDSWSFADTNYWTSDLGYSPISFANLEVSTNGPGNSLLIDSQISAWLKYNVYESTGATNLNVAGEGSVMFWFSPNWASTGDTNDPGATGPGVEGRLLEVGEYTSEANFGWWSLYFNTNGNNISFSAQNADGDSITYVSGPVTFTTNSWHLIALTWTSTNTALFVDGNCLTNGPGTTVLPSMAVISNGFTIGSDAQTGRLQMHGAINSLYSYNFPLDPGTINGEYVLGQIFYLHESGALGNFTNAPYSPGYSQIIDYVSGPGYLQVIGTNTTTCFTNSNVWITNVAAAPSTNGTMAMSFMVTGGSPDLPYDVFGIGILPKPLTNGDWTWLGQAYPCETNIIYGLTNRNVFLVLGTPTSFDGDGLTAAFESLVLHIDPDDPDVGGDGIANGFKLLAGLPLTTAVGIPTLNASVTVPCCPVQ